MVSPIPNPQPPRSRVGQNTQKQTPPPSPPTPGKPSLFARYNALSIKVKLYIWITTAGVAWLADSMSERIFEQNMIEEEANRRVEIEMKKLRDAEFANSIQKNK